MRKPRTYTIKEIRAAWNKAFQQWAGKKPCKQINLWLWHNSAFACDFKRALPRKRRTIRPAKETK